MAKQTAAVINPYENIIAVEKGREHENSSDKHSVCLRGATLQACQKHR